MARRKLDKVMFESLERSLEMTLGSRLRALTMFWIHGNKRLSTAG
jgi:hypothetical protein